MNKPPRRICTVTPDEDFNAVFLIPFAMAGFIAFIKLMEWLFC